MAKATSISVHSLNDPTTSSAIIAKVLQHLREPAYFTTALALYRRLQYGRFFDSSYLFTNLDLASDSSKLADHTQGPWFYAFVDRGCRPETQVWLCGSWEVEGQGPPTLTHHESSNGVASNDQISSTDSSIGTPSNDAEIRALLLSLIHSIKSLPTPPSIHSPSSVLTAQTQILTSHPPPPNTPPKLADPSITLWGAIHSTTTAHLNALNVLATHLLPVVPNHTFIFPLSKLPPPPPLPENLRWGKVEKEHYPLVRSRTEIARQDLTLASLQNLAILPLSTAAVAPIAWAFIGLDGSLTSLHVEESHRRLGLAKALTTKIFREGMEVFWENNEREFGMKEKLAHGNVAVGNEKSAGMCRSLGGVDVGEVFWVKVDLDGVEEC